MRVKKKTFRIFVAALACVVILLIILIILKNPSYPDISTPKPYLGNPDASVHIMEFSDLECPACKRAHPIIKRIISEYGNRISYQYYHFPLPTLHPNAVKAAEAAECANDQGKFYEFIDSVYLSPDVPDKKLLKQKAEELGLDTKLFNSCLDSGAKKDFVQIDISEGNVRNIFGTPSIFINDIKLESWFYDSFKKAVEEALVEAGDTGTVADSETVSSGDEVD